MPSRDRDLASRVPGSSGSPGASGAMIPRASHARPGQAQPGQAQPAQPPASWAALVPHLVVLVCVAAGIYIAWHQGSHGGGRGGVVAGAALLVAAVARLMLPTRLAGLLAVRHRATDVVTLTVLGVSLLTAGLVLPGLCVDRRKRPAQGRTTGPRNEVRTRGQRRLADEREATECLRSR